jgi:hypothetical protein
MERFGSFVGDPINDRGVFGLCMAMLENLRLQVEEIPNEGSLCMVRRLTKRGWKRVTLAYAYKSSGLQPSGASLPADALIVCWEDDWLACPWEVIELRTVVRQLTKPSTGPHDLLPFDDYLQRQPDLIRRLFHRLDPGIRTPTRILVKNSWMYRTGVLQDPVTSLGPQARVVRDPHTAHSLDIMGGEVFTKPLALALV